MRKHIGRISFLAIVLAVGGLHLLKNTSAQVQPAGCEAEICHPTTTSGHVTTTTSSVPQETTTTTVYSTTSTAGSTTTSTTSSTTTTIPVSTTTPVTTSSSLPTETTVRPTPPMTGTLPEVK